MSHVTLEVRDRVAYLTFNRPEAGNALNPDLIHEFRDCAESLGERDDVGAVILTGAGKNFSVGGDLRFMHDAGDDVADAVYGLASTMHAGIAALAALDAPVISVVRGAAAGGGMSIAIAADLVLAAESATFTVAYTAIGFSTDGGSSWTLPRLVGLRRATELALLNERLTAARAQELGHRHPCRARRRARRRGRAARAAARARADRRPRRDQAAARALLHQHVRRAARRRGAHDRRARGRARRPRGSAGLPGQACATLRRAMSETVHIPVDEAGPTVNDVMMRGAETVGPATPLAEAREVFVSPRKKLLLVTDGERFVGTLTPDDVPDEGDGPIEPHVRGDTPRVAPEDPVSRALELVETEGMTRIPVVDEADRLLGLVCFNASHDAFCIYPT